MNGPPPSPVNRAPSHGSVGSQTPPDEFILVKDRKFPMQLRPNPRAKRYLLRLAHDGTVRVTIPRGGSRTQAREFANRHLDWIHKQSLLRPSNPAGKAEWRIGTLVYYHGTLCPVEPHPSHPTHSIILGLETIPVRDISTNLRPEIERYLARLAASKLPIRVAQLASLHQFSVGRVSVRNQRSRWGSCSRLKTISLNWRLIQTPTFVQDYIILHELAHLKHMNHSDRFWNLLGDLFPEYLEAEQWLKAHVSLLR